MIGEGRIVTFGDFVSRKPGRKDEALVALELLGDLGDVLSVQAPTALTPLLLTP
jgi:hypothetical protein